MPGCLLLQEKDPFQSHPLGCSYAEFAVEINIFFLEILLEDFTEDVSVFVAITQRKPERCKKAEKERGPIKFFYTIHFSLW